MPLDKAQIARLEKAIKEYSFPLKYFDFAANAEGKAATVKALEVLFREQLASRDESEVLHGLANVLYWGYGQIAYGLRRFERFNRVMVKPCQIAEFQGLIASYRVPSLSQIKRIGMPEYSGISFISKILMFLDPSEYCVLDWQIAKLGNGTGDRALHALGKDATQIRVTAHNESVYDAWRAECRSISSQYFEGKYRVVDIERGFFSLIQQDQESLAQQLYGAA